MNNLVKVSEATGKVLDYLVILALYPRAFEGKPSISRIVVNYPYSTVWTLAGPIIKQEKIAPVLHPLWKGWSVVHPKNAALSILGPTFLIAAMRCFIADKLGDEVEVPKELL